MSEKAADAESDAQKTANLARIRDNQRRSRARRNEYLKDLESKYRKCEQVGASASAEIQAAARGVAEENRRLRDLLKAYGIPDAEIDRASGRQGSVAASSLEAMASSRRPCGDDTGCSNSPVLNVPAIQPRPIQQAPQQQNQQQASSSSSQPNLCPRPTLEIPQTIATPQYPNQMLSPCSLPGRKQSYDQDLPPPMLQDHQQDPNNPFQTFGLPMENHTHHHHQQQQLSAHDFPDPNGMDFHQDPSDSMAQGHQQFDDLSSCRIAANTIRTFSPNAGYELEQELGCSAPGEECAVPSLRMFNVIDRYTGGSG